MFFPSLPSTSFRPPVLRPQQPQEAKHPPAPKVREIQVPYDKANRMNFTEFEKVDAILEQGSLQIEGLDRVGRKEWKAENLLDELGNGQKRIFIEPVSEPDSDQVKELWLTYNEDGFPPEQAAVLERRDGQSIESFVAQGIENALHVAQHGWDEEKATANPQEDRKIIHKLDKRWLKLPSSNNKKNKSDATTSSALPFKPPTPPTSPSEDLIKSHEAAFSRPDLSLNPLDTLQRRDLLTGMYSTPAQGEDAERIVHQAAKKVREEINQADLKPQTKEENFSRVGHLFSKQNEKINQRKLNQADLQPKTEKEAIGWVQHLYGKLDTAVDANKPLPLRELHYNPHWNKNLSPQQGEEGFEKKLAAQLKADAQAGRSRLTLQPDRLSSVLHDKERLVHHRDPQAEAKITDPKKLHTGLEELASTTVEAEQVFSKSVEKSQAALEKHLGKRPIGENPSGEFPHTEKPHSENVRPHGSPQRSSPTGKAHTTTQEHSIGQPEIEAESNSSFAEREEATRKAKAETQPEPSFLEKRMALLKAQKEAELETARQTPLREKNKAILAKTKPVNIEMRTPPEEQKAFQSQMVKQNPRYISLKHMLLHSAYKNHEEPEELRRREEEKQALEDAQLLSGNGTDSSSQAHASGQPKIETDSKLSRLGREAALKAKKEAELKKFLQIPFQEKSAVALEKHEQWAGLNIPDTQYNPEDVKENFQRLKQDFQKKWEHRQQEENPNRTLPAFRPGKLFDAKLKNQLGTQERSGWHSRHQSIQDFPSTKIKAKAPEEIEKNAPEIPDTLKPFDIPPEYFALDTIRDNPKKEKTALKAEQKAQKPTLLKTMFRQVRNALHLTPSKKTIQAEGSTSHTAAAHEESSPDGKMLPSVLKSEKKTIRPESTSGVKTHQKRVRFVDPPKTEETTSDEAALRKMLDLPPEIEAGTSETTIRPTGKTLSKRPSFQEIRQEQKAAAENKAAVKGKAVDTSTHARHGVQQELETEEDLFELPGLLKRQEEPEIEGESDLYAISPELLKRQESESEEDFYELSPKLLKRHDDEENLQRIFKSDEDDAVIRHIFGANGLNTPASVVRRTTREAAEAQRKADKARMDFKAAEELRRHAEAEAEVSDDPQALQNVFKAQEKALKLSRIKDHAVGEFIVRDELKRAAKATHRKTEAVEKERRQQIHIEKKKHLAEVFGLPHLDDHHAVETAITQKERAVRQNLEKAQQKFQDFASDLRDAEIKKDNMKANTQSLPLQRAAEDAKKASDQYFRTLLKNSAAMAEKQQAEHEKRIFDEMAQAARGIIATDAAKKAIKPESSAMGARHGVQPLKKDPEIAAVEQDLHQMIARGDLQTNESPEPNENIYAEAERLVDARRLIAKQAKRESEIAAVEQDLRQLIARGEFQTNKSHEPDENIKTEAERLVDARRLIAKQAKQLDIPESSNARLQSKVGSDLNSPSPKVLTGKTPVAPVDSKLKGPLLSLINATARKEEGKKPAALTQFVDPKKPSSSDTLSMTRSELGKGYHKMLEHMAEMSEADMESHKPPIPLEVHSGSPQKALAPKSHTNAPSVVDKNTALFKEILDHKMEKKPIEDIAPRTILESDESKPIEEMQPKRPAKGLMSKFTPLSILRKPATKTTVDADQRPETTIFGYEQSDKPGHLKMLTKTFPPASQEEIENAKQQAAQARPDTLRPNAPKQEHLWRFDRHGSPWGPLTPKRPEAPEFQKALKVLEAEEAEASTSKPKEKAKPLTRQEAAKKLKHQMETTSWIRSSSPAESARLETVEDNASNATWSDSEIDPR